MAAGSVVVVLFSQSACGKRADPLPPLVQIPQPVTDLRLAQRGALLEISAVAPRSATDGSRLPVLEVEVLRAERDGDFPKVARGEKFRAAPGEAIVRALPLPQPGTTVRASARAIAKGRVSANAAVVSLTVRPSLPAPASLTARSSDAGVTLEWPLPLAASPVPVPSTAPTPSPSPTPAPTSGFFSYRRAKDGVYGRPLSKQPVPGPRLDDASATSGETWCYVVRTVASADPLIESGDSNESCIVVEDVTSPAAPQGLALLAKETGLQLSWTPSPEADVVSYRVYRSEPGARPARIAEIRAPESRFSDATAAQASVYLYTVTAVDKAGNESPTSAPVEGRVP